MAKKPTAPKKETKNATSSNDKSQKCINLINNVSLLMIGTMTISMSAALAQVAKGFGDAFIQNLGNAEEKKRWDTDFENNKKKIPDQIVKEIASMKKDMEKQEDEHMGEILASISDPAMIPDIDEGIKIVEMYDLGLPKLTEKLDEYTLSCYISLSMAEDKNAVAMFKELITWMNTKIGPKIQEKMKKTPASNA